MTRSRSRLPGATARLPRAASRLPRTVSRRFGLERNALRRRTDRIESVLAIVLSLAFVVGVPLLTVLTVRQAYDAGVRAERAGGERVVARLTGPAPEPAPFGEPGPPPRTEATAVWSYAGTTHTGQVRVMAGSPPGTRVAVWVDPSGDLTEPAQSHKQTLSLTALAGVGSVAGPALALWTVLRLVRRGLIRWQLAVWGAEWVAVESDWSRRG